MSSELIVKQTMKCLLQRDGMEIWLEESKADKLDAYLNSGDVTRFIKVEGQTVNVADITGIYDEEKMIDRTRRKNGEWTCDKGNWHKRGEQCGCRINEIHTRNYFLICKIKEFFENNPDEKEAYRKMDENQRLKYKIQLFGEEARDINISIKETPTIKKIEPLPAPRD